MNYAYGIAALIVLGMVCRGAIAFAASEPYPELKGQRLKLIIWVIVGLGAMYVFEFSPQSQRDRAAREKLSEIVSMWHDGYKGQAAQQLERLRAVDYDPPVYEP